MQERGEIPLILPEPMYFLPIGLDTTIIMTLTQELKALVIQYNETKDSNNRRTLLEEMRLKFKAVDETFPPDDIAQSTEYRKFRHNFLSDIRTQQFALGVRHYSDTPTLGEIIANLSQNKANELLQLLASTRAETAPLKTEANKKEVESKEVAKLNDVLMTLYDADDDSEEAEAFRTFLSAHQIVSLSKGNSLNFTVTNITTNKIDVLKVEDTLNTAKHVEASLRKDHSSLLNTVHAEQLAFAETQSGSISMRLIATDYYANGSVETAGIVKPGESRYTKQKYLGTVFEQMALRLLTLQKAGYAYPDAKNSNWLIDDNDRIDMYDGKSFVHLDEQGNFHKDPVIPGNEYNNKIMVSNGYRIPETKEEDSFNADKAHAFLLGQNIYYFLTDNPDHYGPWKDKDFEKLDNITNGEEYKQLIRALADPNPNKRISLEEGLNRLFTLDHPEAAAYLQTLKDLKFGENDKLMDDFIRAQRDAIINETDPDKQNLLIEQLKTTVEELQRDKPLQQVKKTIDTFRKEAKFYTIAMKDKANKIESAMQQVPVTERGNLKDVANPKIRQVHVELAKHRLPHLGGETKEGEIDATKAAKSFRAFKAKFNEVVEPKDLKSNPDNSDDTSSSFKKN